MHCQLGVSSGAASDSPRAMRRGVKEQPPCKNTIDGGFVQQTNPSSFTSTAGGHQPETPRPKQARAVHSSLVSFFFLTSRAALLWRDALALAALNLGDEGVGRQPAAAHDRAAGDAGLARECGLRRTMFAQRISGPLPPPAAVTRLLFF